MLVADLIAELMQMDPDAEVNLIAMDGWEALVRIGAGKDGEVLLISELGWEHGHDEDDG